MVNVGVPRQEREVGSVDSTVHRAIRSGDLDGCDKEKTQNSHARSAAVWCTERHRTHKINSRNMC